MKYRASVVGCGRIGCSFDDDPKREYVATHAGAYFHTDDTKLVALSDLDRDILRKYASKYSIPETSCYPNYEVMLEQEKPDIISICTWSSSHLEITRKAVEAGVKAIFCEKPIADNLKDAREMVDLCRGNSVILMVDHQRRFDHFHQEVKKFIEDGHLGDIQQVHVYYTAGIANTCSHIFDLMRFFFGEADYVQAVYSSAQAPTADDPNIDGMVSFKSGTMCMLQACGVKHYLVFEFDIMGTKGRLKITRSGFDVEYYEPGESDLFSGYKELYPAEPTVDASAPRDFMMSAVGHIVECLHDGKRLISSGDDGLAALELICAFHESASRDGTRVPLPLKDSNVIIKSR